ncbi:MAG: hypothetical protein QM796_07040 [Chthoniobacteraceae bacterium]
MDGKIKMPIFRFIVRAQPTRNNPKYATWQPAEFIAFVQASNGPSAEEQFLSSLKKFHWKVLEWKISDQLIEERVREAGGDILEAYEMALKRGYWYKVFSEHFMADTMAKRPMSPPRPDEKFIDKIILRAGGRRLTIEERAQDEEANADYILDEYVIEGKDFQEERLAKEDVHAKIGELFWPYFEEDAVVPIDPDILSENDWQRYAEIMARPIRRGIEKACKQVKATIDRMRMVGWKGGIILLNSGYASLEHELFEQIANSYANAHPQLELVTCISSKAQTNGFDSYMNWEFSPKKSREQIYIKLLDAFSKEINGLMTDWGRSGFDINERQQPMIEPISFEYGGKKFTWDPGTVPFSFKKPQSS